MEFKAVKKENSLPEAAKTALLQIDSKHYDTDLKDRGIRDIAKYGIAFAGKKVEIATWPTHPQNPTPPPKMP